MWSAEAGNGLEARVGVGKTGRREEEGNRRQLQVRDESDSKCYAQNFLSPKHRDPRYRTQSRVWGRGGGSLRIAVPSPRTRRCLKRSRLCSGPGGGRKAGGRAEPRASLPGVPQLPHSLLGLPFPSLCQEEEAPAGVSHCPLPEKGPHGDWKKQRWRGVSSGQEAGTGGEVGS